MSYSQVQGKIDWASAHKTAYPRLTWRAAQYMHMVNQQRPAYQTVTFLLCHRRLWRHVGLLTVPRTNDEPLHLCDACNGSRDERVFVVRPSMGFNHYCDDWSHEEKMLTSSLVCWRKRLSSLMKEEKSLAVVVRTMDEKAKRADLVLFDEVNAQRWTPWSLSSDYS